MSGDLPPFWRTFLSGAALVAIIGIGVVVIPSAVEVALFAILLGMLAWLVGLLISLVVDP